MYTHQILKGVDCLISKQREIPLRIKKNEALLRRISQNDPKRPLIEEDLGRRIAGHRGELSLDYHVSLLPKDNLFSFYNLRLPLDEAFFQIDTLLITPNFLFIIEAKNFSGTLFFDRSFNQLIRKSADKEEGFLDPITQVKRQKQQLLTWLRNLKYPTIPIECLVTISNPSTIIKADPEYRKEVKQMVIHVEELNDRYTSFQKRHTTQVLDQKKIKKLINMFRKQHTSSDPDILSSYAIPQGSVITGVQCPQCYHIPMTRVYAKWSCPKCRCTSRNAHEEAILDYFLLLSSCISNKECRSFLHLDSDMTAYRMLSKMNLSHNGKTNGRVYYSPFI
ncbi:NERD domain-containing protein [Bacillus sp. BGMRC 2118]|nr:NERD domain-containing protein [Bacillus sp. BGMRC 2118]